MAIYIDLNFKELCFCFQFKVGDENPVNEPWGVTPPPFISKTSWNQLFSMIDIPEIFTSVKETVFKFKAKIHADTCVLIGGGKSVQYFDFQTLDKLRSEHKDIYIVACNGGSIFHYPDLLFLSSYQRAEDFHWRCFRKGKKQNAIILQCGLIGEFDDNKEYDWMGYTPAEPETYDIFHNDIDNYYMARSGSNCGFFAIKFCLMLGFKNIYLIGFDGMLKPETCEGILHPEMHRFIEIYSSNWCGPLNLIANHRDPNDINPEFHFNIYARNEQQIRFFDYLKTYCMEKNIKLTWLTPTIYLNPNELTDYYLNLNDASISLR